MVTASTTIRSLDFGLVAPECPAGNVVVSGGYFVETTEGVAVSDFAVIGSTLTTASVWSVWGNNDGGGSIVLTVNAVCLRTD
jgi:hypothetical protein